MSESPPLKKHKLPEANSTLDDSLANGADVSVISKKRKSTSASTAAANGSIDGDVKSITEDPAFRYVCPIASPYANKKLSKKLAKLIPKANKARLIRKGVREVQKSLRKGFKGILLLAADTSPVDIIVHLPLVCEDSAMPYCFLPSKKVHLQHSSPRIVPAFTIPYDFTSCPRLAGARPRVRQQALHVRTHDPAWHRRHLHERPARS
jgi:hypothetical protein